MFKNSSTCFRVCFRSCRRTIKTSPTPINTFKLNLEERKDGKNLPQQIEVSCQQAEQVQLNLVVGVWFQSVGMMIEIKINPEFSGDKKMEKEG